MGRSHVHEMAPCPPSGDCECFFLSVVRAHERSGPPRRPTKSRSTAKNWHPVLPLPLGISLASTPSSGSGFEVEAGSGRFFGQLVLPLPASPAPGSAQAARVDLEGPTVLLLGIDVQ